MSAETEGTGLSKSAKKRANKKAREAAAAEEEEEPAPPPAPAAKPKAKAAAKESAEPKGKAAAKPKAEPQSAEPKGKAKAKAEPSAAAAAPKAKAESAQAKPAAKSKGAAKASAKAAAKPEEEKKDTILQPIVIDDGQGGEWETSTGLGKKAQKQKERKEAKKAEEAKLEQEKKEQEKKAAEEAAAKAKAAVKAATAPKAKGKAQPKAKAAEPEVKEPAPTVATASVTPPAAETKAAEEPKVEAEKENLHTITVKVPDDKIARIIGPKGSTMIAIKEKTQVSMDMNGNDCVLTGTPEAVAMAEVCVMEIIEKGYMRMAFDNFDSKEVMCPKIEIPNIIGTGGDIIKEIKAKCKVEIDMPKTDRDPKADPEKKVKISIAGEADGVEKAKECIKSIIAYGHHEITHPSVVHKEMTVEEWQYSFIIGAKGSEMRHIQNNFQVKVNIPRAHSVVQNVLVVGEKNDVDRACVYIAKVLERSTEVRKGRDKPEKAEDTWGEDGPVDSVAARYLVKR